MSEQFTHEFVDGNQTFLCQVFIGSGFGLYPRIGEEGRKNWVIGHKERLARFDRAVDEIKRPALGFDLNIPVIANIRRRAPFPAFPAFRAFDCPNMPAGLP
ncbi:MAG: hypothetical protein OIF40_00865 [Mangrovicoccus sp.]|nr:hypothetical protein [Mangrovicoccus sp.]